MTVGENRVRVKFNPSDNTLVSNIKQKSAELIDLCEQHKRLTAVRGALPMINDDHEVNRLWSLAQTCYEDAAMWAVKAATAEPDKIA